MFLICDFGPKGTSCSIPFQMPSNGILNPFSGLHGKHVHRQKPYNFSKGTCNTLAVQQKRLRGPSRHSRGWRDGRGAIREKTHTPSPHSVNTWGKPMIRWKNSSVLIATHPSKKRRCGGREANDPRNEGLVKPSKKLSQPGNLHDGYFLDSRGPRSSYWLYIPSRKLTYPTLGKRKSSSNIPWVGIC